MPSGLAQVFSTTLGIGFGGTPPTGLFISNRPDGITNQFTTFQGERSYDPSKNAWMSPDALEGDITDPTTQRAYAYDGNSPFMYADPSGFGPTGLSPNAIGQGSGIGAVVEISNNNGDAPIILDPQQAYNYYIQLAAEDLNKNDIAGANVALAAAATIKASNLLEVQAKAQQSGSLSTTDTAGSVKAGAEAVLAAALAGLSLAPVGTAARFTADQEALVALADEARRYGRGGLAIGVKAAHTLLDWARQEGLKALDHMNETHWLEGTPHIHIGPIDHIPVDLTKP